MMMPRPATAVNKVATRIMRMPTAVFVFSASKLRIQPLKGGEAEEILVSSEWVQGTAREDAPNTYLYRCVCF